MKSRKGIKEMPPYDCGLHQLTEHKIYKGTNLQQNILESFSSLVKYKSRVDIVSVNIFQGNYNLLTFFRVIKICQHFQGKKELLA